jgi:precorrin-2 dehydrogenase / sirohydrochlorin ferrochelatase
VKYYTICLVGLPARQTVVVGGGKVAARKVEGLLAAGAQVKVISPVLTLELQLLADSSEIIFLPRLYQDGDLDDAFLVIAATNDPAVNQSVWREAERRGCLVNVVDDPLHSNFILPAVVQRDDLSIAISTGGSSPALARRLRERLEKLIRPEYGILAGVMAELRPELIHDFPAGEARLLAALRVVDSDILKVIQNHGRDAALGYGRAKLHQG